MDLELSSRLYKLFAYLRTTIDNNNDLEILNKINANLGSLKIRCETRINHVEKIQMFLI